MTAAIDRKKVHEKKPSRKERKQSETEEIYGLRSAVKSPPVNKKGLAFFTDLPLSRRTKSGLETAHFVELTEIQRLAVPPALSGRDVVGAAETGSGKTLAFLLPILERLFLEGWTAQDGLGALILAPTRELAVQIFEVLRRIGAKHSLSAGMVIGGMNLKAEREAIVRMNILVATPGRLLQHMDQAVGFEWGNLQVLVLDEADRMLDAGFANTLNAIINSLPASRQTLLFSATQTDSVQSLVRRLSLKEPVFVMTGSLLKNLKSSDQIVALKTPETLTQHVLFSALPDKVDHLWSFVRAHLSEKIIVFVSSCKQVRFLYETFCKLQPGIVILHLHGKQQQPRRLAVTKEYERKKAAVLIATDIAARGLDFPAVDWVVQVDCPESVETYVHRVGRTARHSAKGNSLLLLLQSEKEMLRLLRDENAFPIASFQNRKEDRDAQPRNSIKGKLQALCSQDPELKYLGQKALISYVRSVFLHKNKQVFTVEGQPFDEFAVAIGLPGAPKLRFIERQSALKNANRSLAAIEAEQLSDEDLSDWDKQDTKEPEKKSRALDKMFMKKNTNVFTEHYSKLRDEQQQTDSGSDGELLTVKRRDSEITAEEFVVIPPMHLSRRDMLKTKKRFRLKSEERSTRLFFDDETGEAREALPFQPEAEFDRATFPSLSEAYVKESGQSLASADIADKERQKLVRKEKRRYTKRKSKDSLFGIEKEIRLSVDSE